MARCAGVAVGGSAGHGQELRRQSQRVRGWRVAPCAGGVCGAGAMPRRTSRRGGGCPVARGQYQRHQTPTGLNLNMGKMEPALLRAVEPRELMPLWMTWASGSALFRPMRRRWFTPKGFAAWKSVPGLQRQWRPGHTCDRSMGFRPGRFARHRRSGSPIWRRHDAGPDQFRHHHLVRHSGHRWRAGQGVKYTRNESPPDNYVGGYAKYHGIPPNGGGTLVNQWTLIFDILFPDVSQGTATVESSRSKTIRTPTRTSP